MKFKHYVFATFVPMINILVLLNNIKLLIVSCIKGQTILSLIFMFGVSLCVVSSFISFYTLYKTLDKPLE